MSYAYIESSYQYVTEGDDGETYARFRVGLTEASDSNVKVRVTASSISASDWATPGVDFEPLDRDITFRAGQTSKVVKVKIYGDTLYEADEPFKFSISNARGAELHLDTGKLSTFAQITNDDGVFVDLLL